MQNRYNLVFRPAVYLLIEIPAFQCWQNMKRIVWGHPVVGMKSYLFCIRSC